MPRPNLLDGDPASDLFIPVAPLVARPRKGDARPPLVEAKCASIPVDTPKHSNTSYTLDVEHAGQLGINYLGTGNLDLDRKMKVFVREFMKYDTCEAIDGKAAIVYGAVWRATVLIDQTDATGKVNFAIVAASATLKSLAVQVSITHEGFAKADREAIDDASATAMKETVNGLNVSSFVKFSEQVEKAVGAAMKAKVIQPLRPIGIKPRETEDLLDSVARTFALSYMAHGYGCLDPIGAFPVRNDRIERVIRDTYDALSAKPCAAGDRMVQLAAQQILNGVKFR